ncbi:hypothetical protein J25TS5_14690 [Paenibacillus faecis]|uniref:Rho termination factor N-terminal domain-containing protein n=1 Tax=Paenibacillus faecis TaxID=862114 RepID=UPI001B0FCF40|nr:Rho termination factor N-terminal domain-containing protein [Paenibacillus faecis]GIO84537.1 hypothetical protein J25TS5_14690 [Paenibacillus faecis]
MPFITYRGTNASLTLHGIRFEPKVPVLVEGEATVKKFRDQKDFEVKEEKVIPLEDLTVPQLRDKAKAAGVEGFADMKKAELLAALQGGNKPPEGDPANPEGADDKDADGGDPPTA